MTRAEHSAAVLEAHREFGEALNELDRIRAEQQAANARRDSAEGRLRQLARIEVDP